MKKRILTIACAIFIVLVLGAVLLFALLGGEEPGQPELDGTWIVYQRGGESFPDERLVFDGEHVSDYRDGAAVPFAESAVRLSGAVLTLPDLGLRFSLAPVSENDLVLTEEGGRIWRLLRVGGTDGTVQPVTAEELPGRYDVLIVGGEPRADETIIFGPEGMEFLRQGQVAVSSPYELGEDQILRLTALDRAYKVYRNGERLFFIGMADYGVWELKRG